MVNVTDIHSLSEFQRNAKDLIGKVKASKSPLVLTINGRPAVVVQDAESYQAMVERIREMEDLAAIRDGLAQADAGDSQPASEVFAELKAKHGHRP
jgi:prevent-host-death family protein